MINWSKNRAQCGRKQVQSETFLGDVSDCVSLIPESIDTPVLKKVRDFLEEYDIPPGYLPDEAYEGEPVKEIHLTKGKPEHGTYGTPAFFLTRVKSRIRWQLNDSIYNYAFLCNQKPIHKDSKITELEKQNEGVCEAFYEPLSRAKKLGEELDEEKWDEKEMASKIKDEYYKEWVEETAWDLTEKELKEAINLPEWLK